MAAQKQKVLYICNALDESTKGIRSITSDSYAATNKVFGLIAAMRKADLRCQVLSLGRGRQNWSGKIHNATVCRIRGHSIYYCCFIHVPFFTHFITSISATYLIIRLIARDPNLSVLVYNRSYHYILAISVARLLKVRVYLDLEDGDETKNQNYFYFVRSFTMRVLYNWLCPAGALISNSNLRNEISHPSPLVCYGAVEKVNLNSKDWQKPCIRILFGGTLLKEVGCLLLLDAIDILRLRSPLLFNKLHFVVTGKGEHAKIFREYSIRSSDWLTMHEDLAYDDYIDILQTCHIGLSLRLSKFEMSKTTFPSKVIEYAHNGLLILTSRMDDITILFGHKVLYLEEESPLALANLLESIPMRRAELQRIANLGSKQIMENCSLEVVGNNINKLLNENFI